MLGLFQHFGDFFLGHVQRSAPSSFDIGGDALKRTRGLPGIAFEHVGGVCGKIEALSACLLSQREFLLEDEVDFNRHRIESVSLQGLIVHSL